MAKLILIFSDGTGQIGGVRPDQCLSNVYKMYRAMRFGPDSPIKPHEQIAFYDPGLGAGETDGLSFRRIRNTLSAAVGTGIDQNVIDCYAAIIANYQPGDRICLFSFSRGAYTVRSLANVLNLCGVPTKNAVDGPVPRYGPKLRKIATDAVRYVYNGVDDLKAIMPDMTQLKIDRSDFGTYTTDQFFDHMFRVTNYRTDGELCKRLVGRSCDTMRWLHGKGMKFNPIWGRQAHLIDGKFKFWGGLTVEATGGGGIETTRSTGCPPSRAWQPGH